MSKFTKMLMTRISVEAAEDFAKNCAEKGLSMSAVVREYIFKFNKEHKD